MIDAHNTRQTTHAYGTSGHTHHRAWLDHDGIRVSFWVCEKSTDTKTHHCPDEPDPWVRWAEKVMARQAAAPRPKDPAVVCERHDPSRWRTYSIRSGPVCLSCRSEKRRIERIGRRIAKEASRAA